MIRPISPIVYDRQPLIDALQEYDRTKLKLDAMVDSAVTDADVDAWQAAEMAAVELVQEAFYQVTRDRNSRDHCRSVTIKFARTIAERRCSMMDRDDKIRLIKQMQQHEGNFVHALADAWERADGKNSARIEAAFSDIIARYCADIGIARPAAPGDFVADATEALQRIVRARDVQAETGHYPPEYGIGGDVAFDDWAADIADTILGKARFHVQHLFVYGWDDAGWTTDGVPTTFSTREEAQAEIDMLIELKPDYSPFDYRIAVVA